jgi:glycosyltransferase involved in cell wall biosynthesis
MSRALHVFYLIDQLMAQGGTESNLVRLLARLPRDRYSATVVTYEFNPSLPLFREISWPVEVLPLRQIYTPNAVCLGFRLARMLREREAGLVHCFFESSDLWGAPVARLCGLPVVSSRRDMGIHRHRIHNLLYRLVSPLFSEVYAVSEEVRQWLIRQDRLPPDRVLTIPNGIDIASFRPAESPASLRNRTGLPPGAPLIVSVANLRRVKGQDVLLQAAVLLKETQPQPHFVLAGEPLEVEFVAQLRRLAAHPKLTGRVHFMGPVKDVASLLAAARIFALPSRSEGMSTALLEAMAAGLPAVATAAGGNPEVVQDGETGWLVPPEDPKAMAARLDGLLAEPERAAAMGQRARALVQERFSFDRTLSLLLESYDRVVKARR